MTFAVQSYETTRKATPYMGESSADVRRRQLLNEELCECVAAVAEKRDREAFARIYKEFAPRLRAYAMRGGADAQSAEEVTQEALIAVWRKAASFDRSKASVSTWIFTIVRNKRIDMLRRESRPDLTADDFLHLEQEEKSPDETMGMAQTSDVIRESLSELPDEQAEVLEKAFFEDKSHREIAEELELPLGTVKSRIRLALGRLKIRLTSEKP